MYKHKKISARILSLALTVAMVGTMLPATVFAAEGDTSIGASSIGTIKSFDKLEDRFTPSVGENAPDYVYGLSVALDTPYEDLNLPSELTAMVARTTVTNPAEDEPVVDSGKPSDPAGDETIPDEDDTATDDTVSGNHPASPSDAQEEVKEEIKDEDVPLASEPEDKKTTATTIESENIPVEWKSDKEYSAKENGKFIYTAVLPEGYNLADGVKLPQIYVFVGKQARAGSLAHDISTAALTLNAGDGCSVSNPHVVTGSTTSNNIAVKTGEHWVKLDGVSIDLSSASFKSPIGITNTAKANVILGAGKINTLKGSPYMPGLEVGTNATVSISGTGTLNATGGSEGAGIGSSMGTKNGTVNITDGTINATGGQFGAGIGSGYNKGGAEGADTGINGGTINISGGTVTAVGGDESAGIGGGLAASGGTITISGSSTVNATGGKFGAGIGSGNYGSGGGTISISGGTVTATGVGGAGIGRGYNDFENASISGTDITITDGIVNAFSTNVPDTEKAFGAGIGSGYTVNDPRVSISITITGGTVTATTGNYPDDGGYKSPAAIGRGARGENATIDLTLTDMDIKYKTNSEYTGATNVTDNKIYMDAAQTRQAWDVKLTETAAQEVAFSTLTANGTANTTATTELTLTFDKDVTGLAATDITLTGATKGALTKVAGQTGQYKLAISNITVAESANVNVAVAKTGFAFTPANKNVAVHKAASPLAHNIGTRTLTITFNEETGSGCSLSCSAANPHVITGSTSSNCINISGGTHYINLDNVSITNSSYSPITQEFETTYTLKLIGTNTLTATGAGMPGIEHYYKAQLHTLTIEGDGTLNVQGGSDAPGIGSGNTAYGNNTITINSGTISATGGSGAAGIGLGNKTNSTNEASIITINGGTVNATGGGSGAAGIGSGSLMGIPNLAVPNIVINDGTVTAISTGSCSNEGLCYGTEGVGIGVGSNHFGTLVEISGGTVIATGEGAAVGSGAGSSVLTITGLDIKYNVGGAYTGATNISNKKIYEGTTQTTVAKDVKISDIDNLAQAKAAAVAALNGYTATNATTDANVLALVNKAITDAGITGVTSSWKVTFSKTNATTSAAGSVTGTITLTLNGVTADVTVNLTIAQLTGDKTALTNAISDANILKGTVIVSDSSASSVTSGTKFVNTAEMKALTDAIAAAQAVANNPAATDAEISAAVTVLNTAVANFKTAIKTGTYVSGGSDGGGGGSSSNTTPTKPTEPVTGSSNTDATVDQKGNTTTTVTDKNISDAIKAAKDAATKKGVTAGEVTAVINVTSPANSNPNTVTVNLPKTVQDQIISNKIGNVAIVIDKPDISIGMTLATITEMNKQANADIQLSATRTDATKLSTEAKNAIGSRPAFDLKATYASGSKSVTNFGSGTVSVAIPYTLQNGEVAGGLYAVYVDGNGKVNYITNSSYDADAKMLRFSTNHFSVYGISYKAPVGFTDIANHWAKTDIEFVVNRGLMSGTSNTTFAPDSAMTRGMFVTALGRLAGVDVSSYKTGKFTDVKADAYYAPYVNWAADKGIVKGTTATTFAPDQSISRQEMAVMMSNYASVLGYKVPEARDAVTFADNASIGSWAAPAVKQMQMAGILNGKNGNKFDPTGTATRGEISAMLHRYVELVIDRTTTEGWTTNDSGSSLYYQSGKAVTGAKTINNVAYNFNGYGETTR